MPTVRSHFFNLGLTVNRPLGAAMIWPVEPDHTLVVTGPDGEIAVHAGQHINFRVNGEDRRLLQPTTPPSRTLVPHFDDVAGVQVRLQGNPLDLNQPPPNNIYAICHLSGGGFIAKTATAHNGLFADADWTFQRTDGTTWVQKMTNYVVHEFDVEDGAEVQLAGATWQVTKDLNIRFEQVEKCPPPTPARVYFLHELKHLYALVGMAPIIPQSGAAWAGPILNQLRTSSLGADKLVIAGADPGCDPVCGHMQINHSS